MKTCEPCRPVCSCRGNDKCYKTSPGQMGEGGLGVSEGEDFGFCPQTTILLKSQSCYAIGSGELVESD